MDHPPHLFSHEEASALIPVLRPMLRAIQEQKHELDTIRLKLEPYTEAMRTNGHATEAAQLEIKLRDLAHSIGAAVAEIQDLGIEVKDLGMGLVDFPTVRDNRIVYLCWMVDEPQIDFWHELDTGLSGREPL
ncbi:DUF2203 domain-containing protein [soil metagenome]